MDRGKGTLPWVQKPPQSQSPSQSAAVSAGWPGFVAAGVSRWSLDLHIGFSPSCCVVMTEVSTAIPSSYVRKLCCTQQNQQMPLDRGETTCRLPLRWKKPVRRWTSPGLWLPGSAVCHQQACITDPPTSLPPPTTSPFRATTVTTSRTLFTE